MNFLKRAMRAATRRFVKSLLLLVIFFVVANLVLAGFAIREATDTAKDVARQSLGATVTLSFNEQKAREEAMEAMRSESGDSSSGGKRPGFSIASEPVTEEMALKVAGLEHVQAYNYIVNATAAAEDFDPVENESGGSGSDGDRTDAPGDRPEMDPSQLVMPDVTVVGVYSSALYESFSSGQYTLEEGEALVYDEQNESLPVLIEKTLADYNGLSVGDALTVSAMTASSDGGEPDETAPKYTLTIAGIYSAGSETAGGGFRMDFSQPYNQLIVDYRTALTIKENSTATMMGGMGSASSEGIDSAVFYLDDPQNVDAVIAASKSLDIDWDVFTLDANSAAYESMIAPLESAAAFSTTLVVVVSIAGVIVLALILAMWIRERMYETGVLLSLGESKGKVVCQYISEVLVVALVAFSLSIVSGMAISQKLGDFLLERQNESVSQNVQAPEGVTGDFPGGMPGGENGRGGPGGRFDFLGTQQGITASPVEEIDVSVGWTVILQLFGTGILLALAATAVPSILVMRYKPKDIFTRAG